MNTNLEIEYKTFITQEKYFELLKKYGLENNVFSQTNYYFETENGDLEKMHVVLRIREKKDSVKLTSKKKMGPGSLETHRLITFEEKEQMIKDGFDASIIGLDFNVKYVAKLTTQRVSAPYRDGKIFFDKSTYYDQTDYEVEYEANTEEKGAIDFKIFLAENDIPYKRSISKAKRAIHYLDK